MDDTVTQIAAFLALTPNVVTVGVGIAMVLAIGSAIRWILLRNATAEIRRKHLGSLAVWWVMYGIVAVTMVFGAVGGAITFGIVSLIALREYSRLLDKMDIAHTGMAIVYLAVPVCYATVALSSDPRDVIVVVVATTIGIATCLILAQVTHGFLAMASGLTWAMMVLVFFLAHAAMLLSLPDNTNRAGGGAGWLMYLVVFTECDDIFQALWGRRFGRRKITPVVSPHKTWEGFVLGGLTALLVGILLAPLITPLAEPWLISWGGVVVRIPFLGAIFAGILLWLAGFFGDLNISALKRDVGVKDTGNWLPGQGGILDRIDSLTFTAPVFYYFVRLFYD